MLLNFLVLKVRQYLGLNQCAMAWCMFITTRQEKQPVSDAIYTKKEFNLQYFIHLLNCKPLGLRQEEKRPQSGNKHPRGEKEPCAVAK